MKYIFVSCNLVAITILFFLSPCYSNEEITTSFDGYKKYIPVPVPESVLEHYNYPIPMENQCFTCCKEMPFNVVKCTALQQMNPQTLGCPDYPYSAVQVINYCDPSNRTVTVGKCCTPQF